MSLQEPPSLDERQRAMTHLEAMRTPGRRRRRHRWALLGGMPTLTLAAVIVVVAVALTATTARRTTVHLIAPPVADTTPPTTPRPPGRRDHRPGTPPGASANWQVRQLRAWPVATTGQSDWQSELMTYDGLIDTSHTCIGAATKPECVHGSTALAVIDPSTGRQLATSGDTLLTVGGGWLWATDGSATTSTLLQLDPRTLAVRARIEIPDAARTGIRVAAADSSSVWVAAGKELTEIDTATTAIGRTVDTGRFVYDLAISPDGTALYDATSATRRYTATRVERRNPLSGDVETDYPAPAGVTALSGLSVDDQGAWVGQDGGTATVLLRLRGTPLRAVASGGEERPSLVGDPIIVLDEGNVIWTDISGQELGCDDPATGQQRSRHLLDTIGNTAALGDRLVVATPSGIDLVTPPALCDPRPRLSRASMHQVGILPGSLVVSSLS